MHPSLNRLGRDLEQLRRLFDAHRFDKSRDHHPAERVWQAVNCPFEQDADLMLSRRSLRIGFGMRVRERNDLCGMGRYIVDRIDAYGWPPAADRCKRLVDHDTRQPRAELGFASE